MFETQVQKKSRVLGLIKDNPSLSSSEIRRESMCGSRTVDDQLDVYARALPLEQKEKVWGSWQDWQPVCQSAYKALKHVSEELKLNRRVVRKVVEEQFTIDYTPAVVKAKKNKEDGWREVIKNLPTPILLTAKK